MIPCVTRVARPLGGGLIRLWSGTPVRVCRRHRALFRLPELLAGMPNPPPSGCKLGKGSTCHGQRRPDRRQPPQRAEKHRAEDGRGQGGVEPECAQARARRADGGGCRRGSRRPRAVWRGAQGRASAQGRSRGAARRSSGGRGLAASARSAGGGGALQPRRALGPGALQAHPRALEPPALRDGGPPQLLPCAHHVGAWANPAPLGRMVFVEGTEFWAPRRNPSPWRPWRFPGSLEPVGSRKNRPKTRANARKSLQSGTRSARIPALEALEDQGLCAQPLRRHQIMFS